MKDTCNRHTKEIEAGGNPVRAIMHCNGCLAATIKWHKEKIYECRTANEIQDIQQHIETLTNSLLNHLIKGE